MDPQYGNSGHHTPSTQVQQLAYTNQAPRPLSAREQDMLAHLDNLRLFLITAPYNHATGRVTTSTADTHPALNRFALPNGELVSCVYWQSLYHITGTDIVRALVFRFEAFGRPVRNLKKFEEGVFSDLRNLKPGIDACLEEPKSPFLELLFKYQCIRTQKKQKVFYWFSVPHDRLFLDALERDTKREKMGLESTTEVVGEPARSFVYDPRRSLYDQFIQGQGGVDGESDLERAIRLREDPLAHKSSGLSQAISLGPADSDVEECPSSADETRFSSQMTGHLTSATLSPFSSLSLIDGHAGAPLSSDIHFGGPKYKQRKRRLPRTSKHLLRQNSVESLPASSSRKDMRGHHPYKDYLSDTGGSVSSRDHQHRITHPTSVPHGGTSTGYSSYDDLPVDWKSGVHQKPEIKEEHSMPQRGQLNASPPSVFRRRDPSSATTSPEVAMTSRSPYSLDQQGVHYLLPSAQREQIHSLPASLHRTENQQALMREPMDPVALSLYRGLGPQAFVTTSSTEHGSTSEPPLGSKHFNSRSPSLNSPPLVDEQPSWQNTTPHRRSVSPIRSSRRFPLKNSPTPVSAPSEQSTFDTQLTRRAGLFSLGGREVGVGSVRRYRSATPLSFPKLRDGRTAPDRRTASVDLSEVRRQGFLAGDGGVLKSFPPHNLRSSDHGGDLRHPSPVLAASNSPFLQTSTSILPPDLDGSASYHNDRPPPPLSSSPHLQFSSLSEYPPGAANLHLSSRTNRTDHDTFHNSENFDLADSVLHPSSETETSHHPLNILAAGWTDRSSGFPASTYSTNSSPQLGSDAPANSLEHNYSSPVMSFGAGWSTPTASRW